MSCLGSMAITTSLLLVSGLLPYLPGRRLAFCAAAR